MHPRDPEYTPCLTQRSHTDNMDALHRSILGIWTLNAFGQDWWEERPIEERTTFNIVSAFALENGNMWQGPIETIYENELTERFPRDDAGGVDQPRFSETDQWHQHLVRQRLLSAKPPSTTATLNVIYVHNDKDSLLGMSGETFLDIFAIFGLDISFLHSMSRDTDTWHFIRRDDGTCTFLFVLPTLYYLACSISLPGRQTNCVFIRKRPYVKVEAVERARFNFYRPDWFHKRTGFKADRAFPQLLERIQSHHLHHPLSLAYLCLLDSLSSIFVQVTAEARSTFDLENATEVDTVDRESLDRWVSLSQKAGRINVRLARLSKALGVASLLLETLEDRKRWKTWCQKFVVTADYQTGLHGRASRWLVEGLPSCRQLLENEKIQLRSQEDRVKTLTPIVSKLSSDITYRIA